MDILEKITSEPKLGFLIEGFHDNNSAVEYDDLFIARIKEVYLSLERKCYLSALTMSLTLPDICGKAEFPELSTGKRYKKWCEKYLECCKSIKKPDGSQSELPYLNDEALYNLRNNVLHAGDPGIEQAKIKEPRCAPKKFRLVFGDSFRSYSCRNCASGDAELWIGIDSLCKEICVAAITHYISNQEKYEFTRYSIEKDFEVTTT